MMALGEVGNGFFPDRIINTILIFAMAYGHAAQLSVMGRFSLEEESKYSAGHRRNVSSDEGSLVTLTLIREADIGFHKISYSQPNSLGNGLNRFTIHYKQPI